MVVFKVVGSAAETFPSIELLVKLRKRVLHCSSCLDETGDASPSLRVRFSWSERGGRDCTLGDFLHFVFEEIESRWDLDIQEDEDFEKDPLADIIGCVPLIEGSSPLSLWAEGSGSSRRLVLQARRVLLTKLDKSTTFKGGSGSNELFDILTDAHLTDFFDLVEALTWEQQQQTSLIFATNLSMTQCPVHDVRRDRRLAQLRVTSRRWLNSLRQTLRGFGRRSSEDGSREFFGLRRNCRRLLQALMLPEIGVLLRSGLYTPTYLDRQISEVHDLVGVAVVRGFSSCSDIA